MSDYTPDLTDLEVLPMRSQVRFVHVAQPGHLAGGVSDVSDRAVRPGDRHRHDGGAERGDLRCLTGDERDSERVGHDLAPQG